jgi:ABC-2 type transport system permease protein
MMAARITRIPAFTAPDADAGNAAVLPLWRALPARALPALDGRGPRFDPIAHAVYPMRHAVFSHLNISPAANAALSPALTWAGDAVPVALSLGIVALMGAVMLGMGCA